MTALSFKKRFCARVEAGDKRHTIRDKRKRPWKVGDKAALYYAMRTKQCRLLGRTKVLKVEDIVMDFHVDRRGDWEYNIRIDGIQIDFDEAEEFAKRDGFTGIEDLADFWATNHPLPFNGDVIHWAFPFEESAP